MKAVAVSGLVLAGMILTFTVIAAYTMLMPAAADHSVGNVVNTAGTSVPGCEKTDECFVPSTVTIDVGGEVTWFNDDDVGHTITSGVLDAGHDGKFDSGLFPPNAEFSHKFEEAGGYPYFCRVHPWMSGLVVVQGYHATGPVELGDPVTYTVEITNITPGQPITPPLLVTHNDSSGVFTLGEEAGYELQQLAENGNMAPLVPAGNPGDTGFGYTETLTITADEYHAYLSFVSMLVCTNDGFAGIDSVLLPTNGPEVVYAAGYDARTETNTEDFADMVQDCQILTGVSSGGEGTDTTDARLAEEGIVIPHPGIVGGADLTGVHAWTDPVVKITIIPS